MSRSYLRLYVYRTTKSTYELGRVTNHFYEINPLAQVSLPVPASMLDPLHSGNLNSLQQLGVRQSLYPFTIVPFRDREDKKAFKYRNCCISDWRWGALSSEVQCCCSTALS